MAARLLCHGLLVGSQFHLCLGEGFCRVWFMAITRVLLPSPTSPFSARKPGIGATLELELSNCNSSEMGGAAPGGVAHLLNLGQVGWGWRIGAEAPSRCPQSALCRACRVTCGGLGRLGKERLVVRCYPITRYTPAVSSEQGATPPAGHRPLKGCAGRLCLALLALSQHCFVR